MPNEVTLLMCDARCGYFAAWSVDRSTTFLTWSVDLVSLSVQLKVVPLINFEGGEVLFLCVCFPCCNVEVKKKKENVYKFSTSTLVVVW